MSTSNTRRPTRSTSADRRRRLTLGSGLLALLATSLLVAACGEATTKFKGARVSYTVDDSTQPEFRDKSVKFSQDSTEGHKYTIGFDAKDFFLGLPTLEEKTYRAGDEIGVEHNSEYRISDCDDPNFRVDVHRDYDLVWGTFSGRLCGLTELSSPVTLSEGTFAAEYVE